MSIIATFVAIPERTQTASAMRRVLDYVMQDRKTLLGDVKLVSGQNCVPESAYQEFMATKHQYGKATGVFFKQYVQSFSPNCGATPELIHRIGVETAKAFDGYEVVVATHVDRDHWHNHFVVNSVSCETGLKIQINEQGLERLRQRSDEICQQFVLEVLTPYQKPKQRTITQREYRTALRGDSKKFRLANAIDYAVAHSRTKQQFIDEMERLGYGVKWIDRYKYITYTTPDGQRFRDNRLLDNKYLKTNMEELFAYGYRSIETEKPNTDTHGENRRRADNTHEADLRGAPTGANESAGTNDERHWEIHCQKHGFTVRAADAGQFGRDDAHDSAGQSLPDEADRIGWAESGGWFDPGYAEQPDGDAAWVDPLGTEDDDPGAKGPGSDAVENPAQMGADWRDIAIDGLYLAADLGMISGGGNREKHTPKYIPERKNTQKKNGPNNGPQMTM